MVDILAIYYKTSAEIKGLYDECYTYVQQNVTDTSRPSTYVSVRRRLETAGKNNANSSSVVSQNFVIDGSESGVKSVVNTNAKRSSMVSYNLAVDESDSNVDDEDYNNRFSASF